MDNLGIDIFADIADTLQQQRAHFDQLHDRNIASFPLLIEFVLNDTADLFGHLRYSLLFIFKEIIHTFLTELLCIEVGHDIIQLIKWIICHFSFTCIVNCLIMPIIVESWIISVRRQYFALQGQVLLIQHPLAQVGIIEIFLTIILISFLIYISLIIIPVVVFELEEDLLADSIGNMFENAQLWINHTLDTKRIHFLGASYWHLTIATSILSLIILQRKIIHILKCIRTDNIVIHFVLRIDEEHARIHIVANDFWQFCQRVDCHAILINVAIQCQTICYAFYFIIKEFCFSASTCHIMWNKATCLQRVQLIQCGITILVIATLIHICVRQVHLRNHGIHSDISLGESLTCLYNSINNRTRTCTTT